MYKPTYIRAYQVGLVQDRPNFLIPNDAFPVLLNMIVWREKLLRKSGYKLLGRLRRELEDQELGTLDGNGDFSGNIRTILSLETNAEIEPGTFLATDGTNTFTDDGAGIISGNPAGSGTINYVTTDITITGGDPNATLTSEFFYFPALPVMGLRERELNNINFEQLVAFDQTYAYVFLGGGWQEFIPGTTWTGTNSDFFWSTNYWVGDGNLKIMWVTNFSGPTGDPIRYTNGAAWIDFAPIINSANDRLNQCLAILPFRGRLLVFNTWEGQNLATSVQFRQRIRWSAIGNPFSEVSSIVSVVNADAWRDDIVGQGGFLDIPTAENIVSVGFVRDNLVIFCERSTWQLRYTGRSIAPFQIEKVNTELGAESTFSAVQFDTTLVGIGDKGVVNCDSYKSERIDIKIPDLVFRFQNDFEGLKRVHGIRDFQQRTAYWTYVQSQLGDIFPNRRLVYNYENDSWAIFKDSFTTLGTYQADNSLTWEDFPPPDPINQWQNLSFPWLNRPAQFPSIVGGNQQGFVEKLGQFNFQAFSTNDISLSITGITGNSTTATVLEVINHNLQTDDVIEINFIPEGTPFDHLNGQRFGVVRLTVDTFELWKYSTQTEEFSIPQTDEPATYIGGGKISIRDNFVIQSKKFNFLEDGQAIDFGYMDILLNNTDGGAITLNVYLNYNDTEAVNTFPQNDYLGNADPFFNRTIPTHVPIFRGSTKNMQRIYCNCRGSFVTLELTFSKAQMVGNEQEKDVQIENQILWMRPAGRQLTHF